MYLYIWSSIFFCFFHFFPELYLFPYFWSWLYLSNYLWFFNRCLGILFDIFPDVVIFYLLVLKSDNAAPSSRNDEKDKENDEESSPRGILSKLLISNQVSQLNQNYSFRVLWCIPILFYDFCLEWYFLQTEVTFYSRISAALLFHFINFYWIKS